MRFIIMSGVLALMVSSQVWSAEDLLKQGGFPFSYTPVTGKKVTLNQPAGAEVFAQLPNGKQQKLATVDTFEASDQVDHIALIADFNFDGANDVALLDSLGYGGVNYFYSLFLWDKAKNKFNPFKETLSNPNLNAKNKILTTETRSGPLWYTTKYRVNKGSLYPVAEWAMIPEGEGTLQQVTLKNAKGKVIGHKVIGGQDTQNDDTGEHLPNATAQVSSVQAWLYEAPKPTVRSKMYLIKGDRVSLLNWQQNEADGTSWFLVQFKGAKLVEKWLPSSDLTLP